MRNPIRCGWRNLQRPRLAASLVLTAFIVVGTGGCANNKHPWRNTDISGSLPKLSFDMVRARDGKAVTSTDYRGKVVLLYFGYTYCPDACPTTLANISQALRLLGPKASTVRVLFVTVDPNRDTLSVLRQYEQAFAPQV